MQQEIKKYLDFCKKNNLKPQDAKSLKMFIQSQDKLTSK